MTENPLPSEETEPIPTDEAMPQKPPDKKRSWFERIFRDINSAHGVAAILVATFTSGVYVGTKWEAANECSLWPFGVVAVRPSEIVAKLPDDVLIVLLNIKGPPPDPAFHITDTLGKERPAYGMRAGRKMVYRSASRGDGSLTVTKAATGDDPYVCLRFD